MKLKKLLAFGLALVMCLAMAACGTNPDENPEESTLRPMQSRYQSLSPRVGLSVRLLSCYHAYGIPALTLPDSGVVIFTTRW